MWLSTTRSSPEEVVAPQPGEQHLPGEDPPRRGQKGAQQLEFPGRQIQGRPSSAASLVSRSTTRSR